MRSKAFLLLKVVGNLRLLGIWKSKGWWSGRSED